MKFRKKPIVINAFQLTIENVVDKREWPDWLKEANEKPVHTVGSFYTDINGNNIVFYKIGTLEGVMNVCINDWIIRGINDEIYPCKPDIFELTYEKV